MRCNNPDCMKVMRSPSPNTKETGLCGGCRKEIENHEKTLPKLVLKMKPRGRSKAKKTAIEKFEESLKNNPEYNDFINMFRSGEKINVRSV